MSITEKPEVVWKWGLLVALAMIILALYPQLYLVAQRNESWAGSYAYFDTDEVAYSAYVQALIDGRPRKNNPYTGRDELQGKPLPESFFSVQFAPAYMAATPARILGLSSSSIFIVLMPIVAASTALTLFWLLAITTGDSRLAAVGVVVVLCVSTFVSGQGPSRILFGSPVRWNYLPFLRRYIPGLAFPLFLLVFGLVWRTITAESGRFIVRSIGAGLAVCLLIFSYFYLWTATIAWLSCLALVLLLCRPEKWKSFIVSISITILSALIALIPYLFLLSQRDENTSSVTVLVSTRAPDLFRPSEVLSLILLVFVLALVHLGHLSLKGPKVLFLISLLLLPFAVFNQQILTGLSLQPFHYEEFVTSYCVLLAAVIAYHILSQARLLPSRLVTHRVLFWIAVLSFTYGVNSASGISRAALSDNLVRDKTVRVGARLRELSRENPGLVFTLEPRQAETLPTLSSDPMLWALHMGVFPGIREDELKERFYHYLYYSGVSSEELRQLLATKSFAALTALFGAGREAAHLSANFTPVTAQEAEEEVRLYSEYLGAFDRQTAAKYLLSYFVVPAGTKIDTSYVDRWYERDLGEQVDDFIIYRLKLRE